MKLGTAIIAAIAFALVIGIAGPSQAGGAYPWPSRGVDCAGITLNACGVWDSVDPDMPVQTRQFVTVGLVETGVEPGGCVETATGFTCVERYESAPGGDHIIFALLHNQKARDGTYNFGGVYWDGTLASTHVATGGTPDLDLPAGQYSLRVNIIDDSGARVGGFFCTDNDGDELCSENVGELAQAVCGSTRIFKTMDASAIFRANVFVDGPTFQTMDCPGSMDVAGGSSGIIRLDLTRV